MASREELLQSIRPGMKLTKDFFLRIYGYELTWPGFAENALRDLESAGCSRAREYYNQFKAEADEYESKGMKEAAAWYHEELKKKWNQKEGEERRIQEKMLAILQSKL